MIATGASRVPVKSSSIASIGYSWPGVLDVEFKRGPIYRYFFVPRELFERFLAAESKGTYFNRVIKGPFPYCRVD